MFFCRNETGGARDVVRAGRQPSLHLFRVQTDRLLTVVAALEPGERGSFPWAKWYSDSAPSGEFRKVPGGYARFVINDAVASTMIDAIRAGRSLPDQLIEQLPVCWGPEGPSYPSE